MKGKLVTTTARNVARRPAVLQAQAATQNSGWLVRDDATVRWWAVLPSLLVLAGGVGYQAYAISGKLVARQVFAWVAHLDPLRGCALAAIIAADLLIPFLGIWSFRAASGLLQKMEPIDQANFQRKRRGLVLACWLQASIVLSIPLSIPYI